MKTEIQVEITISLKEAKALENLLGSMSTTKYRELNIGAENETIFSALYSALNAMLEDDS